MSLPLESEPQVYVVFTPSGLRGRVPLGTSILEAAQRLGVDLDSVCGGRGICGRCQVQPSFGHFPKFGVQCDNSSLSAFSATETRYSNKRGLRIGRRLGCSTKILSDLIVDIPPESQLKRQLVRKRPDARPISIDPVVRLFYVEVKKPRLESPSGDCERLIEALKADWSISIESIDFPLYTHLQETLQHSDYKVTALVRDQNTLVRLYPGLHTAVYGIAVDIGSTTMSAQLVDLQSGMTIASQGRMNPQIRFGEDLMSRVSYAMMNAAGAQEMTAAIRSSLDELFEELQSACALEIGSVVEVVLVGNPIMHHIFWGIDPVPLGGAPFALASAESIATLARECGFESLDRGARLYTPPCIGGHVGADAAAVALSEALWEAEAPVMAIDIGTNAEILLGVNKHVFAASSPTGPAFEGAQITNGQRAAPGAIERVRIDTQTLRPRFKAIDHESWSNEPGFALQAEKTPVTGLCGSGIIEVIAELYRVGLLQPDGLFDKSKAERTPLLVKTERSFEYILSEGPHRISITQNDVRAIQLAKAALHAGARLLMQHAGVEQLSRVLLAGAFGSHIDPLYALILGLVPDCPPKQVVPLGNAASTGARMILVDRTQREALEVRARAITKIETATEPAFQQYFIEAMGFPHSVDPYTALRAHSKLPAFLPPAQRAQRRGARRQHART